jgi:hypothetical protein
MRLPWGVLGERRILREVAANLNKTPDFRKKSGYFG